jgi:hypothetical protein
MQIKVILLVGFQSSFCHVNTYPIRMIHCNVRLHKKIVLNDQVRCSLARNTKKMISPAGNRTLVSRVTGGDTYHYTTEDYILRNKKLKYLNII